MRWRMTGVALAPAVSRVDNRRSARIDDKGKVTTLIDRPLAAIDDNDFARVDRNPRVDLWRSTRVDRPAIGDAIPGRRAGSSLRAAGLVSARGANENK